MIVNVPRFRVLMNGAPLLGVQDISTTLANAFQIGKFRFTKSFVAGDKFPASWFADTANKTMRVQIDVAVDGQTYAPHFTGDVDSHGWNPISNQLVVVGRDLAALFADQRTFATYRNLTSSEIAQQLADKHGLQASVTPTTTIVGRYYDTDHDQVQSGDFATATNEWDLLCQLGSKEGIIPYVAGNTLYFNRPPTNPPVFAVTLTRGASGNVVSNAEDLQLERHLTQARDVVMTVRSWSSKSKAIINATVRVKSKKVPAIDPNTGAAPLPSNYVVTVPNLSKPQALALAQRLALDISQHERNAIIKAPSFVPLTPQHVIQVSGTETDYDMTYYPQTITQTISVQDGASTSIQAKFSSPAFLYDDDSGEQIGETAS